MLLKRPLDMVGTMPENRVVGERHPLTTEPEKVFTLDLGSFYTNSVVIRDAGNGNVLVKGKDYNLLGYNVKAAKECGGKQIDTIVVISRSDVAMVAVDYQAVGGVFSNLSLPFIDLLNQVKNTDRSKVDWMEDIINKPDATNPTPHTHEVRELSDLEDGVNALTKLLASIYNLDVKDYKGVYAALYRKINNVKVELDESLDFINTELDLIASKSAYQPGDVIVGDFSENPVKFYPEVDWVLLPESFLYGNTLSSSTDPITVDVRPGTGLVARTTHIYVAVPKGGAKYALSRSKTNVNEGDSVEITITALGATPGSAIPYVITGISAADILQPLTGSFILDGNLMGKITIDASADFETEGDETMRISLVADPSVFTTVKINDTSKTPVFDVFYSSDQAGASRISSTNEGTVAYFQVRASNISDDTVANLFYGGTAGASDFGNPLPTTARMTGSSFTLPLNVLTDETTEGNEVLLIKLSLTTEDRAAVAATLTIVDTSRTPSYDLYYSNDAAGSEPITRVNEGDSFYLNIIGNNVPNGTLVGLTYGGTANIYDLDGRYDNLTINNGKASGRMTARADFETEGDETLIVNAFVNGRLVKAGTLIINDTSASANTSIKFSSNSTGSNLITQANEGDTFYLVISALANLPDGTVVDIRYEGTASDADFVMPRARSATILNQRAVVEYTTRNDFLNENDEVMRVRIINTANNIEIGTSQITIKDTSQIASYSVFYSGSSTSDSAITQANEGQTVWLTVTGSNIPNGKILTCEQYVGGLLAITTNGDVDVNPSTTITMNSDRGSIPIQLRADMRSEGDEPLLGIVKADGVEVGRREITVKDTSITPTYKMWFADTQNGDFVESRNFLAGQDVWLVVETTGVVAGTRMYLNYEGFAGNLSATPTEIVQGTTNRVSIKYGTKVLWNGGWNVTVKLFTDASRTINAADTSLAVGSSIPTMYFSNNALGNNNLTTFNEGDDVYAHMTFPNVANNVTAPIEAFIGGKAATVANGHVYENVLLTPTVSGGRAYTTFKLKDDLTYTGDMVMYFGIVGTNYHANATVLDKPVYTDIIYTGSMVSYLMDQVYNGVNYVSKFASDMWEYFNQVKGRYPTANERVNFIIPDGACVLTGHDDWSSFIISSKWNATGGVTITNRGLLLGMGGFGGGRFTSGGNGRPAVINNSNKTVTIINHNVISGGGGGGGSVTHSLNNITYSAGGGAAAPWGVGSEHNNLHAGAEAAYLSNNTKGGVKSVQAGSITGGDGGAWGQPGKVAVANVGSSDKSFYSAGQAAAPFVGLVSVTNVDTGRVLGKGYTS